MEKKIKQTNIILIIIIGLLSSCATIYKPINPTKLNYKVSDYKDGIELSYKYDVLRLKGNKKYAKSEDRAGVRLVAVKIVSNTDTTLNLGTDVIFYSGNKPIALLTPFMMENRIKQISTAYLPYVFFTFLRVNLSNSYYSQSIPVGYFLGPLLTFGNIIVANSSNKNLLNELNKYDITDKKIKKGETVYGLMSIDEGEFVPLSIKLNKNVERQKTQEN